MIVLSVQNVELIFEDSGCSFSEKKRRLEGNGFEVVLRWLMMMMMMMQQHKRKML